MPTLKYSEFEMHEPGICFCQFVERGFQLSKRYKILSRSSVFSICVPFSRVLNDDNPNLFLFGMFFSGRHDI